MNLNINITQLVPTPDYVQPKQSLHGRKRKYVSSVSGLCLHFPFSSLPAVPGRVSTSQDNSRSECNSHFHPYTLEISLDFLINNY
ncbi:hypothetical protein CH063_01886 [Colletotrichum higginsianum]|uniref:Uncharacterized protein n=1 Tax=Colletotrichum higginsianum (strain IMI 349063) TaxID=759273 RepID=H1VDL0_COLHI|nr:hypothetical protein CH063_01886 [Colletotrichum higginsianum]